ncbi:MAG: DHH family phosphoesterase [Clostridia bacterium]|nr:DHH family phosphoesterase [Clostridia bacterium]
MFNQKKHLGIIFVIICSLISIGSIALFAILLNNTNESIGVCAVICGAVCLLLQYSCAVILRYLSKKGLQNAMEARTVLGDGAYGIISDISFAALIIGSDGRVIWYNRAFSHIVLNSKTQTVKQLSDLTDIPLEEYISEENGIETEIFGSFYLVKAYGIVSAAHPCFVITFEEKDEEHFLRLRLEDENTLVAYIAIDNLDELYQYAKDRFSTASGEVAGVLNSWAKDAGGVLFEYTKDRFIFLFEQSHLSAFIENKFDILDRVRNVNVGDVGLPVTVSIGISTQGKTLLEKDANARSTLETALQRGGDQVVIRRKDGIEYYGARVQTSQELTRVGARVFSTKLAQMIAGAGNVLVMAHVHPDFDAIGACIGIARLSMYCGTKVNIITDFSSEDIKKCMKKLRSVPEYEENGIFIDSCQAQDMINGDTLLVIVDVNNPAQIEAPDLVKNAPEIVYIDHHRKYGDIEGENVSVYIKPSMSSSCEIVCEILEYSVNPGTLQRDEADIMLAGIMLDTKQFLRNTGSRTFGSALYLRREGALCSNAQELFKTGLEDLTREAAYETNVVIYRNHIAISQSGNGDDLSVDRVAAAKAADKLLNVKGVYASFVLCTMENSIHISARSSGKINVQLIIEKLGGGGHFESAATQLKGIGAPEAVRMLKSAIDEYLNENEI